MKTKDIMLFIKAKRESQGASQAWCARKMNIPAERWGKYEKGMITPRPDTLFEMLEVFQVTIKLVDIED